MAALSACASPPATTGKLPFPLPVADATSAHASQDPDTDPESKPMRRRDNRRDPDSRLEVTINGAGTSDDRLRAGSAQLAATVGYYLTDVLVVAVRQNVSTSKTGTDAEDLWDGATRFAVDYLFPLENVVPQVTPYVGVNIGYLYGDSVRETMAAGPELGLKYYVKPDVFLQVGAEYEFTFKSSDRLDRAFENGSFFYGLGFGVCF